MADSLLEMLLRHLTGWAEGAALAECSDGQLLERFVTHREEAAFAGLLHRHGPMVLSICRRTLANEQDCEDVFQATFLLLVHKAGSIRCRESVGSWLHGVAHRLTVRCRAQEDRRRVHERQAGLERTAAAPAPQAWEELRALLDEAIAELPEKYRSALVLCYLEDHTHEEAARRLGCRLTTLRSRVARGRERLRDALLRRGLALSSAAFLAALATSATQAALPPALRIRTLTAALPFAKGDAVSTLVSASTAALVEGGLHAMSTVRLKILLIVLLISGLTLGGAGLLAHQMFGAKDPADPPQPSGERAAAPPPENKPQPAVDRFGDPLPQRAIARLGTVRFRMGGLVGACAWSPDGMVLAAGENLSYDASLALSLFDAGTGKPLRQLRDHQFCITSLAYSPDGRTLACGSQGAIVLWDPATGKEVRRWDSNRGQGKQVWSLAFTPDGKGLISAGEDTRVHFWDPATGKEIRQFTGHEKDVRCAVLSPAGQTLASAADQEIRLWETATGKMIRRLTGQKEPIRALAFSPDGKLLASGGAGFSGTSSVWLWETATGKVHLRLPEEKEFHKGFTTVLVRALAFSPDGKALAAGHADYTLRLWDAATGKKLHEMPGVGTYRMVSDHDGGIQCVAFSRDGKRLAFARDNQLALLDVPSGKEISPLPAPRGAVQRVFFSPDGNRLFTTNEALDQPILEWDAASGRLIRQPLPGKLLSPHLIRFSPDRKIMFTMMWDDKSQLRDAITGDAIRPIPIAILTKTSGNPRDVAFSPDGKLLAVEEPFGKAVWLIDVATGKQICTVEGMKRSDENASGRLTFSPDGWLLAMADGATIRLAEVPSGRQLPPIVLPKEHGTYSVAISPDGRSLAIPCYGNFTGQAMLLLEAATGKERLALPGPPMQVACAAFSPDGRLLAGGGRGRTVLVWDIVACKQKARLEGHQGYVQSLAFSPDGRRLASGSKDTTTLIWDVSGLAEERRRPHPLTREELDELWSILGSADAAKAYQAILTLESCPDQSVPLLAERFRFKPAPEAKQIAHLLAQLDNENFPERERATKQLREIGWAAEASLHKVLEGKPSAEVRRRVKELLDDIHEQTLRMLRGMEVLEHIGTPAARKVIASLAEGTPQARLTREAKAAVQRLRD
jgi:RNA polymerase sigma factor (sigma-70 family)